MEYKKGTAPDLPEGAWEPERVQLCAQALILRDNGYDCEEGVTYLVGSKKRVTIPISEQLAARTLELAAQAKALAASGRIPPPLVDSPKCPRCSLVGICLPDEVNALAPSPGPGAPRPEDVRRLFPARDDAFPVHVQEQGARWGRMRKAPKWPRVRVRQEEFPKGTSDRLMTGHQVGPLDMAPEDLQSIINVLRADSTLHARAPCGHEYRLADSELFHDSDFPPSGQAFLELQNGELRELVAQVKSRRHKLTDGFTKRSVEVKFGKTVDKAASGACGRLRRTHDDATAFAGLAGR